jgi:hypothetical protein
MSNDYVPLIGDKSIFSSIVSSCKLFTEFGLGNVRFGCKIPEGHGANHRLHVRIKKMFLSNSHSNEIFWEHPVSPIFTVSYSNPAIDFIRGGQHLRTNGNEEVVLV